MIKTPIEVSARHLHLNQIDLNKLFGKNYQLKKLKPLSQKGEFSAKETVTLVGPKGSLKAVRVIGPIRSKTQIELTLSEARVLGINPPLRISGDLRQAAKVKIIGSAGEIISKSVIVALRHLHLNSLEAKKLKLKEGQITKVAVKGDRGLILDNVIVRVGDNYKLTLHLDTDEANATGLRGAKNYGQLILK